MPRLVKGSTEEREQYMAEVFRKHYADPANSGRDLSIDKANAEFRKKFGSMLRNKRAYEIRSAVKTQLQGGGKRSEEAIVAHRHPESIEEAVHGAVLIEGGPTYLVWLQGVLAKLTEAGLANAKVDHTAENYAVVTRI